jgi:3-oxoacyl-[acyl-carrier-protein] synthase III
MKVKIAGTGTYLPKDILSTEELLTSIGIEDHQIGRSNGVQQRHVANIDYGETTSKMAAWSILKALENADLQTSDLDLIIFASAAFEQPVPDTSALVQLHLGLSEQGTPSFSIHATCLGFLQALDVASTFVHSQRYQCIAIVCSEIASKAINPFDPHSYTLFGDAAAAAIIVPANSEEENKIHNTYMTTFSEGAYYTEIVAGGTRKHPNHHTCSRAEHSFSMRGKEILKFALPKSKDVLDQIWPNLSVSTNDIDHIVTHQPSRIGLLAFQKFFPKIKTTSTLHKYGNCVSTSLPLTLHEAIQTQNIQRGNKILLFGMGAGLSIGGMVLTF